MFPVDPHAHPNDQAHQALTYADAQGWLVFRHVTAARRQDSRLRRYVIAVPAAPGQPERVRELAPTAVLPYVTGLADARGHGHLFPPREDTPTP
jgi:hypothetical protein